MTDIDYFNKSLTEFVIAYQKKASENQIDKTPNNKTIQPYGIFVDINSTISFPHLILEILKEIRKIVSNNHLKLSAEDQEMVDAFDEIVSSFPKYTSDLLDSKIRIRFNNFINQNGIKLDIEQHNKVYGHMGNIAFLDYLKKHKHSNSLITDFSDYVQKNKLLDKIDFILNLLKYNKGDIDMIKNMTVHIKNMRPLVLPSIYIDKDFLIEEFDKIESTVDYIKSITGWNNIKSSNLYSDLLNLAKQILGEANYVENIFNEIVFTLKDKVKNKTQLYVFLNDTLHPFIEKLRSEEEILLLISKNNDAATTANINRRKKRAVENILKDFK